MVGAAGRREWRRVADSDKDKAGPQGECRTRRGGGGGPAAAGPLSHGAQRDHSSQGPDCMRGAPERPCLGPPEFGPQSVQLELLHTCFCSQLKTALGSRRSGGPGEEKM